MLHVSSLRATPPFTCFPHATAGVYSGFILACELLGLSSFIPYATLLVRYGVTDALPCRHVPAQCESALDQAC